MPKSSDTCTPPWPVTNLPPTISPSPSHLLPYEKDWMLAIFFVGLFVGLFLGLFVVCGCVCVRVLVLACLRALGLALPF